MSDSTQPHDEQPWWRWDLWAVALAMVAIAAQGNRFGVGNQDWQIAAMRRVADPSYIINDWSMSVSLPHEALTHLLAWMAAVTNESWSILLMHIATRVLLMMGAWRLARALVPRARLAPLMVMAMTFFEPRFWVGGHFLQGGHWEAAYLGMAAGVWILAQGVAWIAGEGHWSKVGFWGGFGVFVHLFIGIPVLTVVFLAALLAWFRKEKPFPFWEFFAAGGLALLVGAPAWIPAANGFFRPGEEPLSNALLITILEVRHPHHHMPWTWNSLHLIMAALTLTAGWVALDRVKARPLVPWVLLAFYVGSSALFVYATWTLTMKAVVYFQAFRLLGLLLIVAACSVATLAEDIVQPLVRRGGFWKGLAWGVVGITLVTFRFRGAFILLAMILIILSFRSESSDDEPGSFGDLSSQWFRIGWIPVVVAGACGILALQTIAPVRHFANRHHHEHWLVSVDSQDPARRELTDWIATNTDPQAVLLVPPGEIGFRIAEKRAIVVDWKSVPYENAPLWEWIQRNLILTNSLPSDFNGESDDAAPVLEKMRREPDAKAWMDGYNTLTLRDLRAIAQRYGAKWIVTYTHKTNETPAFENSDWMVWPATETSE